MMKTRALVAIPAAVLLIAGAADAGDQATKTWTKKIVAQELAAAERRIQARVGRLADLIGPSTPLAAPLHADLPRNTELTLAHVGDDLAVVALCALDSAGEMWAGAFVISSGPDFAVMRDDGSAAQTDALGFFARWTGAVDHPTRDGALIMEGRHDPNNPGLISRVATARDGETFYFEAMVIVYTEGADGCEITSPIMFSTNGSAVDLLPEGADPVPLPTTDGAVSSSWIGSWKAERFPWSE